MADFAVRTLRRPGAPVYGTVFRPTRPCAGVLVIGGSGGSEPSYLGEALARAGIGALSVAYFGRPGLPGQLRDIALEYFLGSLGVLEQALAPGVPLVVLGMSRGSEAAMLTAIASGGRVGAVVASVPGNVVAGSWPPGGRPGCLRAGRCRTWHIPGRSPRTRRLSSRSSWCPGRFCWWAREPIGCGLRARWRGRCPGDSGSTATRTATRSWSIPTPVIRSGT